jgi:ParB family transcriptional regulator, chromosome partitioning protein
MTEILQIPLGEIKPDPDQPRQRFNESELEELAANVKSEGVINPIEIDKNNVIITGERRWRAAKIAGLKTVPCFVNELRGKERFKHQLSENIHHNTMSDLDTAEALDKVLNDYKRVSPGDTPPGGLQPTDAGISWLSKEIGKSRGYILEKLALLQQSNEFKDAIEDGAVPSTMVRAIQRCPGEHRKEFEEKVLLNEFPSRDAALEVATALEKRPDKAEELLREDYSDMNTVEALTLIRTVAPAEKDEAKQALKDEFSNGKEIINQARKLRGVLAKKPITEVSRTNLPLVLMSLAQLLEKINLYIDGQEVPEIINQ